MSVDTGTGGDDTGDSGGPPGTSGDGTVPAGDFGASGWLSAGILLGSWILGQTQNKRAPDPVPITAPYITQSQRGIAVPITFGTNRVPAELFWSKNFTPVRHKNHHSNGFLGAIGAWIGTGIGFFVGGPSGAVAGATLGYQLGSGGPTQPDSPYTYTVDVGYNFGIVDQPSTILRGWLGSSPMTIVTLAALNQGSSSILTLSTLFSQNGGPYGLQSGGRADGVSQLTFADVFYSPGYGTANVNLEAWPYFASTEGVTCSWPYTVVLGLQALDLGSQGQTPQLSLELGSTVDASVTALNNTELVYTGVAQMPVANGGFAVIGDDGNHYVAMTMAGSPGWIQIGCMETLITTVITAATWNAELAFYGFGTGTHTITNVFAGPDTNLVWAMGYRIVGADIEISGIRYEINSSGTVVPVGGFSFINLGATLWPLLTAGAYGAKVIGGYVYVALTNADAGNNYNLFPCILKISTTADESGTYTDRCKKLTSLGANFFVDLNAGVLSYNNASILQTADGIGLLAYVTQNSIAGAANTVISALSGPAVLYIPLGTDGLTPGSIQDWTTNFGVAAWDHKTFYTGAASTNNRDEYQAPWITGGRVVFARSFSDNRGYVRLRQFVLSTVDNSISDLGMTTTQYDAAPVANEIEEILVQIDTDAIYIGARYLVRIRFGQISASFLDVTPPYIIYRILTSDVFGFGLPTNRINTASYNAAVALCESLGILVSVTYASQTSLLSTIDELLSLYAGFLVDDAGIVKFGLVQETDVPDPIAVDNTRLVAKPNTPPVTVTKGAVQDGYNIIRVNYLDRLADYNNDTVELPDEIDMEINGPRLKEFNAGYVMSQPTAYRIAERALWSNLYGKSKYEFQLGPKDAHRLPGDLITLVDSWHHELRSGAKARIVRMHEIARCVWDVQAVSVNDYQISAIHSLDRVSSSYEVDTSLQALQPMLDFRMYEVPTEFGGPAVFVGYNQASAIAGANLYVSLDGSSLSLARTANPFIVSGRLTAPLQARDPGFAEDNVTLSLMPASGSTVNSPTYAQTIAWGNVSQSDRANGGGVLMIGSEALSIEGINSIAQNSYKTQRLFRGWGGTPITSHNSGDFWHCHENGVLALGFSPDQIGAKLWYKVTPYDFLGNEYPVSSVDVKTYTIKGDYFLPREQSRIKVWVNSAASWPASAAFLGTHLKVVAGGADAILTWPDASNVEGYGAGGFGKGAYGHFLSDVLTPAYRVDVYSINGTAVSSFVANTGYFDYNVTQNSTDFNGAVKDLWFKVTPYNVKGDAYYSDQRTLTLFW